MADKNTDFHQNNMAFELDASAQFKKSSINIRGKLLQFDTPKVMGILNITPDSFYHGSRMETVKEAIVKAGQMIDEGAAILDIGAYSSRPGAADISEEEELERLRPVLQALVKEYPDAVLSVDTFRSKVAETAVGEGAHIVNDISAGNLDPEMIATVARLKVPYVFMHMKGTPQNMKELASYEDVVSEVFKALSAKLSEIKDAGIKDYIVDPGFGFAKTISHNYELLNHFELFKMLGAPVLAGLSRKSMIWKTLDIASSEALNGTTVLNTVALLKGADLLRVHDVRAAVEAVKLVSRMNSYPATN